MTHIMLDLETWGKVPGSDIRSIGAVVFDPTQLGGCRFNKKELQFYIATDNPIIALTTPTGNHWDDVEKVNRLYPLTHDPETVQWWNDQTPEAQAAFVNPVDLKIACNQFTDWLYSNGAHITNEMRIWANDPHFDVSILDAVFRAVGLPVPWHYRSPRSMKTITEAAGMTSADYSNYGTAHNALDDAIAQAMTVCEAYKRLGLQR